MKKKDKNIKKIFITRPAVNQRSAETTQPFSRSVFAGWIDFVELILYICIFEVSFFKLPSKRQNDLKHSSKRQNKLKPALQL